jgi:excisionase family DNA binding protein
MSQVIEPSFLYLSVPEAAIALDVTEGRVRQLLIAEQLHGHKLGEKNWAISAAEIERFKSTRRGPGRPTATAGS